MRRQHAKMFLVVTVVSHFQLLVVIETTATIPNTANARSYTSLHSIRNPVQNVS